MTLRTVAAETSRPYRRVTVCEPTASPVARYSDTTACKIFLARPPISTLFFTLKTPRRPWRGAARRARYSQRDDLPGQCRINAPRARGRRGDGPGRARPLREPVVGARAGRRRGARHRAGARAGGG